ncbi:MAG: metal ABC transporter substrate-binding protein [Lachnospiraceae bacterium]|nr:metal ABC transporter substrate-binding protein [Lachnospiraceae bacterium]
MKKYISFFIAAVMAMGAITGCGQKAASESAATGAADVTELLSEAAAETAGTETADAGDKIEIVTTIFPEYDWVENILGDKADNAEVTMLLDNGVDLHSYQPSAEDIMKISTCDLFVYVGGESDAWVDDALKEAVNKDMKVVNLLNVLGESVKEEEVVEGMQAEDHEHEEDADEHDHEEDADEHDHEEGEVEYDEHVWLSLKNSQILVNALSESLQSIDAANAESYKANAEAYNEKLAALDAEYQKTVDEASVKTVLFGDRFPFRYLVDDYGLSYYAAFVGCSAETEASFETITFLSQKVDELSLKVVLTIEGNDHRIADTIVSNTKTKDQKVLTMDSMQATTSKDVENGTTYYSIMENNLSVLKEALN